MKCGLNILAVQKRLVSQLDVKYEATQHVLSKARTRHPHQESALVLPSGR